eukprot:6491981-Amphidinium_carterae.1
MDQAQCQGSLQHCVQLAARASPLSNDVDSDRGINGTYNPLVSGHPCMMTHEATQATEPC